MGDFWKSEEDGERGELGRDGSVSGSEEEGGFSWDRPLFKKYGLLLAKNKKMGFKIDTLLYWPSRLPVFCTGGPCARGSPRHSLAYCPFERKKKRCLQLMATHR